MATVFDVAAYILNKQGSMSAIKLEKLVYYSQAWSLVWDGSPLFRNRIEAWANGPVVPALYAMHRKQFELSRKSVGGNPGVLSAEQKETIDAVLLYYGDKSPLWLSDLTHSEDPWKNARKGLKPGDRGNAEITHAAMANYYSSL
jgi:uncharacterized phage-associated protein